MVFIPAGIFFIPQMIFYSFAMLGRFPYEISSVWQEIFFIQCLFSRKTYIFMVDMNQRVYNSAILNLKRNNMEHFYEISIFLVNMVSGHVYLFLSSVWEVIFQPEAGNGIGMAFALSAAANIPEGVLAQVKRWHGSIGEQFNNIDNAVNVIDEHQSEGQTPEEPAEPDPDEPIGPLPEPDPDEPIGGGPVPDSQPVKGKRKTWPIPTAIYSELTNNRNELQRIVNKCKTADASTTDRAYRNSLLKSTVGLCLTRIKIWAYGQYDAGVLTADDVHRLGFLLPGELGGHHDRAEGTNVVAEVSVRVINEDNIRVVIDQSGGENAAHVIHGWPTGVRNALIVIVAADGKTEVYRAPTTRLHNNIRMPDGSHGKQFIIKASFLRHTNDAPRFGNEPTFSMPITTQDLAAALDRQHHEEYEAHVREVERQRLEIERLEAALNAKK